MQAAEDVYGNNPPKGFNEMWEAQKDGKPPCDFSNFRGNDEGGCTPGLRNFSKKFGHTRVWWLDHNGELNSQDFVNGSGEPIQNYG